jgi:hypothetical protein
VRELRLLGKRVAARWIAACLLLVASCQGSPRIDTSRPSERCASCHLAEFQAVSRPPHPGVRPTTCGVCHLASSWHPFRLQHAWPLEGAHAKADCFDCHRGEPRQFEGTTKACVSCHQKEKADADGRVAHHPSFGERCESCHGTSVWKPILTNAVFPPQANPSEQTTAAPEAETKKAVPRKEPTTTPRTLPTPTPSARSPVWNKKPDSVTGASRHAR